MISSAFNNRDLATDTLEVMTRRSLPLIVLLTLASLTAVLPGPAAGAPADYRPDGWIKLCGLSTGCTIQGLPNPWKGKNVHNTTGNKQSISVRMEDGEGVRFWILIENDGQLSDTITVDGCRGNRRFRVNRVQLGKHKRPDAGAVKVTDKFRHGTLDFSFPPTSTNKRVFLTLNIVAPTTAEGVSYECKIVLRSQSEPMARDVLVTKMTTY